MDVRQWTDDEWRKLETSLGKKKTSLSKKNMRKFQRFLIDLTQGQYEHPEWYDSPCLCDGCKSCE